MLLRRATLLSQPEDEKVYSLGGLCCCLLRKTDWLMYAMSEINDPSKEVKVRFIKKSGQYIFLSKKLEKWFPKSAIPSIDNPMRYSFDTIGIKSICDKIKTLDRGFKMDLHICKSQLK